MSLTAFDLTALITKWLVYLSFAAVVGGAFMFALLRQSSQETTVIRRYIRNGAMLGLLAVLVNYLAQVGSFSGTGLIGMFDYPIHTFLWPSSVGSSVRWRIAGFILASLASLYMLYPSVNIRRIAQGLLLSSAALLAIAFTQIGHSAELSVFARTMVFVHVLAIGCWLGSFYPLWRLCNSPDVALIKRTMDSFGLLGIVLVSLVVFSGASLLWQLFNNLSEFVGSSYGLAILVKLTFVLVIMLFAALHKFILVPKLTTANRMHAQQTLQKSIAMEALVGLCILAVTAYLSSVLGPVSLGSGVP